MEANRVTRFCATLSSSGITETEKNSIKGSNEFNLKVKKPQTSYIKQYFAYCQVLCLLEKPGYFLDLKERSLVMIR